MGNKYTDDVWQQQMMSFHNYLANFVEQVCCNVHIKTLKEKIPNAEVRTVMGFELGLLKNITMTFGFCIISVKKL